MTAASFVRPHSLQAALQARADHPDWTAVAGGTDLMVGVVKRPEPKGVIDLFGLAELRGVTREGPAIRIGAGTTYAELLRSPLVRERLPLLHAACREVGAMQIQERGTLGGNVATSSPVGDTLPCLLALDAELELRSAARGARRVAYHAFCTGYRKIDLKPDELIVAAWLPDPAPGTRQLWRKVGTRRAQAISKVMVAATARVDGGRIAHLRLAMGAVADRPIRLAAVEALALHQAPGPELAARVRDAVRTAIRPITDVRSTAEYRLESAAAIAARFVEELGRA